MVAEPPAGQGTLNLAVFGAAAAATPGRPGTASASPTRDPLRPLYGPCSPLDLEIQGSRRGGCTRLQGALRSRCAASRCERERETQRERQKLPVSCSEGLRGSLAAYLVNPGPCKLCSTMPASTSDWTLCLKSLHRVFQSSQARLQCCNRQGGYGQVNTNRTGAAYKNIVRNIKAQAFNRTACEECEANLRKH